jgi:DNA-binding XRE family transcriptional regulator
MSATKEVLAQQFDVRMSTERKPYHYVGAGLSNVYLIGVEYRVDRATTLQSADIPCLPSLLDAIARVLLTKRAALSGDEMRFLRKRLRMASKDFAGFVGLSVEQYSRLENGSTVTPTVDRVVRFLYVALAKLPTEAAEAVAHTSWTAEMNHEQRIVASQDENHHWIVKTKAA